MSPFFTKVHHSQARNSKRTGKRSWSIRSIVKSTIAGGLSIYGLVQSAPKAKAQSPATYTWSTVVASNVAGPTDVWSNATRWTPGAPVAPGTSTDVLRFNHRGAGTLANATSVNDLGNYTLQALVFDANQTFAIRGNGAPESQLYFDNANSTIQIGNSGALSILSPIVLSDAVTDFTITRFSNTGNGSSLTLGNATAGGLIGALSTLRQTANIATTINNNVTVQGLVLGAGGASANITAVNALTLSVGTVNIGSGGILVSNGTLTLNSNVSVAGGNVVITNGLLVNANAASTFNTGFQAVGGTSNFTVAATASALFAGGFYIGGAGNITGAGNLGTGSVIGLRANNALGASLQTVFLNNGTINLNHATSNAGAYNFGIAVGGGGAQVINTGRLSGSGTIDHTISNLTFADNANLTAGLTNITAGNGFSLTAGTSSLNGSLAIAVNGGSLGNLGGAGGSPNQKGTLNLGTVTDVPGTTLITKTGNGTLIVGGGYVGGGYTVTTGTVQINDVTVTGLANPAAGNVTLSSTGAVSFTATNIAAGLAANKISTTTTGTLALLSTQGSEAADLSAFDGMHLGAQLGSNVTYTGTYTPGTAGVWRFGGGGGNLTYGDATMGAINDTDSVVIGGAAGYAGGFVSLGNATSNYTGTTTINGSVLTLNPTAMGNTSQFILNGGTLRIATGGTYTLPANVTMTSSSSIIIDTPSLASATTPNYTIPTMSISNVTFTSLPNGANVTAAAGYRLNINSLVLTATAGNATFNMNVSNSTGLVTVEIGNITQTTPGTGLVLQNLQGNTTTGAVTQYSLTGTNTFSGVLTTTNSNSIVTLNNANALTPSVNLNFTGGTVRLNGNSVSVGGPLTTAGGLITNVNASDATLTQIINTAVSITGNYTNGAGGGTLSWVKAGSAFVNQLSNMPYTGQTYVASGALVLGRTSGFLPFTSALTLSGANASISFGDASMAANNIFSNRVNPSAMLQLGGSGGGGNLTFGLGNTATVQTFNGNFTLGEGASVIQANVSTITATAATNLILNGNANRLTGGTLNYTLHPNLIVTSGINFLTGNGVFINGGNRLWLGATANGTDFITVSGLPNSAVTPTVGYTANIWASGSNTEVLDAPVAPTTLFADAALTDSLRFSGNVSAGNDITYTLFDSTLTGNNVIQSGMILFVNSGTGTGNITVGNASTLLQSSGRDLIVFQNRANGTTAIGAIINDNANGATALTKAGTGVLTLTGNNTYTGVNYLNQGILQVSILSDGGANSSIGASSSAASNLIIAGGSTLRYNGTAPVATDRRFTITGEGTGNATVDNSSVDPANILTFESTANVAFAGVGNRNLGLGGTNTGNNVFAMGIFDSNVSIVTPVPGLTGVFKNGTGTWVLTNTNGYSGNTTIAGGILGITSDSSIGTGTLNFGGIGTLRFENATPTLTRLVALNSPAGGAGASFDTNGNDLAINPTFVGTGNFTKVGAGNLVVTNTVTTTGNITVTGGRLVLSSASSNANYVVNGTGVTLGLNSLNRTGTNLLVPNGNVTQAANLTFSTITVGNLGGIDGGNVVTGSTALNVLGNGTNRGIISNVARIVGGPILANGIITNVGGNMTGTTLTVGNVGLVSNIDGVLNFTGILDLRGNAVATRSTISNVTGGIISTAASASALGGILNDFTSLSVHSASVGSFAAISGNGTITTTTGNLSLANGATITSIGNVLVAATLNLTGVANMSTTGNVTTSDARIGIGGVTTAANSLLAMSAGSSLTIGNGTANLVQIGIGGATFNNSGGIVDARQASSVVVNTTSNLTMGFTALTTGANDTYGFLRLPTAASATTTLTAAAIEVGAATPGIFQTDANVFGPGTFGSVLDFGNQTVTINTSAILIGRDRSSGTAQFSGTGGNVTISGAGTTILTIGENISPTTANIVGLLNGAGGSINGNIGAVRIGVMDSSGGNGSAVGVWVINGSSNLTASSVYMGNSSANANSGANVARTSANLTVLGGSLNVTGAITTGSSGNNAIRNTISVAGGALTAGAGITLGSGFSQLQVSAGSLVLGGAVTTGGNSTFSLTGGTLNAANNDIGSFTHATTPFTFSGGTLLNASNIAQTGGFTKSGTGELVRNQAGTTTVNGVYSQTGGNTTITAGTFAVTGNLSQSAGVTSIGFGSHLQVDGVGGASITSSTLQINGTATVSGAGGVSVGSAGVLSGTGTLTSLTVGVAAGGILSPGASIGTLGVIGNVALSNNANFTVDIGNGNTSDLLNMTTSGSLDFTTGSNLIVRPIGLTPESQFTPYQYTLASVVNGATNVSVDTTPVGGNFNLGNLTVGGASFGPVDIDASALGLADGSFLSLDVIGNNVVLTVTATPEPMSVTLIAAAGLGAFGWVRRRRTKKTSELAN